jgi:hypothetical protein
MEEQCGVCHDTKYSSWSALYLRNTWSETQPGTGYPQFLMIFL